MAEEDEGGGLNLDDLDETEDAPQPAPTNEEDDGGEISEKTAGPSIKEDDDEEEFEDEEDGDDEDDEDEVECEIVDAVIATIEDMRAKQRQDDEFVSEMSRRAVRRCIRALCGKNPHTEIHLIRV